MSVKIYKVGGAVRDMLMRKEPKDLDFAVEASSYAEMRNYILENGDSIYQENPEYVTLRARLNGESADFVLCRKESGYSDGRRPDKTEVGTIVDDLSRRDLTINAIAIDESGNKIDPFNGHLDIILRVIRCVGNPIDRLNEDGLRALRAIRFAITLGDFNIEKSLDDALSSDCMHEWLNNVSEDRIREELRKCFVADTKKTIELLQKYDLLGYLFQDKKLWLKPTTEAR